MLERFANIKYLKEVGLGYENTKQVLMSSHATITERHCTI